MELRAKTGVKFSLPLLIALLIHLTASAGGGWVRNKSGAFFKLNYSHLSTDKIFNYDGSDLRINKVGVFVGSIYGEYGLTDKIDGILYFPFFYKSTFNNVTLQPSGRILAQDQTKTIGDAQVSIKYGLIRNSKVVVSTSLLLGLPTGSTDGGVSRIMQTGDGEFNQAIGIDASYSAYPIPVWVSTGLMFNNRTKGFSDEYSFSSEIGIKIMEKGFLVLKSKILKSFKNGYANDFLAPNFSNNIEFHNISFEIGYKLIKEIGIVAGISHPIAGRKSLVGTTYSTGLFIEIK